MDWLKEILEKATVTEDGKLDVEATLKAVTTEFPKHAVPKKDYNDKVAELKTANDTIKELKESDAGNEELQKKIGEYEKEIKNLKAAADTSKKESVLKEELRAVGAKDPDYIIYKQGGVEKFSFQDGKPIGISDIVKPLKDASPHLFNTDPGVNYNPAGGDNPPAKNPFAKDSFNLTEQGKMLRENPEQAKAMAAAAGVALPNI